jgi:Cu/Ag efflux pump CusA
LGRAVIGGLLFATVSTLYFVPVIYAAIHQHLIHRQSRQEKGSSHTPQES